MMLGAVRLLASLRDELAGEVRVVFQPSEENGKGAKMMIAAGATDGVRRRARLHIWSEVDAGTVSVRARAAHGQHRLVPHRR